MGGARLSDAETKAVILQSILKSPELRSQPIDIEVTDRTVILRGTVETPLERAALEQLAQSFAGSRSLTTDVAVRAAPSGATSAATEDADSRLPKEVEFALYKTDAFEVKTLKITSQNRVVRLSGTVRNLAEKLLAERIARGVPDVRSVVNELEIVK